MSEGDKLKTHPFSTDLVLDTFTKLYLKGPKTTPTNHSLELNYCNVNYRDITARIVWHEFN